MNRLQLATAPQLGDRSRILSAVYANLTADDLIADRWPLLFAGWRPQRWPWPITPRL